MTMRPIRMKKKGIFFSIVAILIVIILFVSFYGREYITIGDRTPVIKDRVTKVDSFVRNLEGAYLERALRVSGITATIGIIEYLKDQGTLFTTMDKVVCNFRTAILYGNTSDISCQPTNTRIVSEKNLMERLVDIENASRSILFVDTELNVTDLSVFQNNDTGPWYVGIVMNISYKVNTSIASWKNNKTITTRVSIFGMEDPYLYIMSGGAHNNTFKNVIDDTTTDSLTNDYLWDITYLDKHIQSRTYKPESNAPNFLMRLYGNTGSSPCCGMESTIYFGDMHRNMAYIDYCYWSETCPGSEPGGNYSLYNITGITTPSYKFLLEPYHIIQFNVSEYAVWTNVTA